MPSHFMYKTYSTATSVLPSSRTFILPDNAVLFGYSYLIDTSEYFNTINEYGTIASTFTKMTTYSSLSAYRDYGTPFIKCVSTGTNWNFENILSAPSSVLSTTQGSTGVASYAIQLDSKIGDTNYAADQANRYSGRHGFVAPHPLGSDFLGGAGFSATSRPAIDRPTILAIRAGETASTTGVKYNKGGMVHEGHYHSVYGTDIAAKLFSSKYGTLASTDFNTNGLNLLPVQLLKKDPNLPSSSGKPVTSIPKGILVLGNNLSLDTEITNFDQKYTMNDAEHINGAHSRGEPANSSAFSNIPLYLVHYARDCGVMTPSGGANTIQITATSNTSGLHTHNGVTALKSNATGQSGDLLGPAGAHNHDLTLTVKVQPKSKWLNGWITLLDETPLANGMIIGYSPTPGSDLVENAEQGLPAYWHFCDGNNNTPDLRDYNIAVNMNNSNIALYNTEVYGTGSIVVNRITVGPSGGEITINGVKTHSHVIGREIGTGTPVQLSSTIGSHAADPERWHIHSLRTSATHTGSVSGTSYTYTFTTIQTNTQYSYNPSNLNLAFIMLNKAIQ